MYAALRARTAWASWRPVIYTRLAQAVDGGGVCELEGLWSGLAGGNGTLSLGAVVLSVTRPEGTLQHSQNSLSRSRTFKSS